ncbi:MAG TPA: hypothetical protein VLD62_09360 [Acidimicrobiia bacterium]|nr:hypothetical protein [Acidimicrobiia bacterium]
METVVAWYGIGVGALMGAWWAIDLSGGALDRPDRSRTEMELHLAAEFLTALALVVSGITLLAVGDSAAPFVAAALGMLLYTLIVSPGYFMARHRYAPATLFAVLAGLTIGALLVVVT